jgi:hypothetical protein
VGYLRRESAEDLDAMRSDDDSSHARLLRKVALDLDRHMWPEEIGERFFRQSRSLCNFVSRKLKGTRVLVGDTGKIVVEGAKVPKAVVSFNSEKVTFVRVPFDADRFLEAKEESQRQELFMAFLLEGLRVVQPRGGDATTLITERVEEFRRRGYKNEWIHKSHHYPHFHLVAKLACSITEEAFQLTLHLERPGEEPVLIDVLRTEPDDVCWEPLFKDIELHGDELTITARIPKPLATFKLRDLMIG